METGHPIPTRCPACGGRNLLLRRQFVTWDTHAVEGGEFIERFGGSLSATGVIEGQCTRRSCNHLWTLDHNPFAMETPQSAQEGQIHGEIAQHGEATQAGAPSPATAGRKLTAADRAALENLPADGWFELQGTHISRAEYRCERLRQAGMLERRTLGNSCTGNSMFATAQYRRVSPKTEAAEELPTDSTNEDSP
ncbi:hypothetical protein N0754_18880 [Pseudomonas aeruginosa]|nr:hypothetical protein [Pseudomonas aeruginosa]MCS9764302.1 hypothetical protein [Pseudomonas aeruginosa]MCS9820478.1 hypothetical protein [Pseudomonas aeruginosa]MCT0241059.1 hypothetical protein [Pseudomonas aeruginosa]MCT0528512.1 hypothetical protein [Pseudomonas aeruginosa]